MSKKLARFRLDTCPNQYFAYGPDMDGELLDWQIDLLRAFDEKRARFFILEVGRRSRKGCPGSGGGGILRPSRGRPLRHRRSSVFRAAGPLNRCRD